MTIVEALKRLRIIEKKVQSNCTEITRYASGLSTRKPVFESEARQRKEVSSLVQSSADLLKEYLDLKRRIEVTNLNTTVEIEGSSRSIAEWLIVKRKVADLLISVYNSMNDTAAAGERREDRMYSAPGAAAQVVRYYSEEEKNKLLRKMMDQKAAIDGRLEVINATTPLLA
jgi:flagellar motility protein MotE (MotC chaperone)